MDRRGIRGDGAGKIAGAQLLVARVEVGFRVLRQEHRHSGGENRKHGVIQDPGIDAVNITLFLRKRPALRYYRSHGGPSVADSAPATSEVSSPLACEM